MKVAKTLKTMLRRRKNKDRVYVYDEEVECIHRSAFMKVFSAIGFVHLPKRQKYQPETLPKPSKLNTPPTTLHTGDMHLEDVLEEDIEVINLGDSLPPNPLEGQPWDPMAIVIAWEYPEEEMPVFLDFHYLGYGY